MTDAANDLAQAVTAAERCYAATRRALVRDIARSPWPTDIEPEEMRDVNGRFILLEAAAQIAFAKAVQRTAK